MGYGGGDAAPMVLTPKEWGPHFWFTFYTVAIAGPEKPSKAEQDAWAQFTRSFAQILPCGVCKSHFKEILEAFPPEKYAEGGRDKWIEWVLAAHNTVRDRQKKKGVAPSDVRFIIGGMVDRQQGFFGHGALASIAGLAGIALAVALVYYFVIFLSRKKRQ